MTIPSHGASVQYPNLPVDDASAENGVADLLKRGRTPAIGCRLSISPKHVSCAVNLGDGLWLSRRAHQLLATSIHEVTRQ